MIWSLLNALVLLLCLFSLLSLSFFSYTGRLKSFWIVSCYLMPPCLYIIAFIFLHFVQITNSYFSFKIYFNNVAFQRPSFNLRVEFLLFSFASLLDHTYAFIIEKCLVCIGTIYVFEVFFLLF